MAGYMAKLNGYLYTGEHVSDIALENGMIVKLSSGKVVKATKTTDYTLTKIEDADVHGVAGARYEVAAIANPVFFVENEIEYNDSEAYNTATYIIPAGKQVRMHPLFVGEECFSTIANI